MLQRRHLRGSQWLQSHDGGAHAVFNDAIKVEDYKASYIEAL